MSAVPLLARGPARPGGGFGANYYAYRRPYSAVTLGTGIADIVREITVGGTARAGVGRASTWRAVPLRARAQRDRPRGVVVSAIIGTCSLASLRVRGLPRLRRGRPARHRTVRRAGRAAGDRPPDRRRATELAPRRYLLVALSDHGQTRARRSPTQFGESVEGWSGGCAGARPIGQARSPRAAGTWLGGRGVRRATCGDGRSAAAERAQRTASTSPADRRAGLVTRVAAVAVSSGTWRWCRSSSTRAGSNGTIEAGSRPATRAGRPPASGSPRALGEFSPSRPRPRQRTGSRRAQRRTARPGPHAAALVPRVDGSFPPAPTSRSTWSGATR
jgi:hypothetical protein